MIRLHCYIKVEAQGKETYSTDTVIERRITELVPPGVDPMEHLASILHDENRATRTAFAAFPQYTLIAAPQPEAA